MLGLALNVIGAMQSWQDVPSAWAWIIFGTGLLIISLGSLALSQQNEIQLLRARRPLSNQPEIIATARQFSNAATRTVREALRSHYLQAIPFSHTSVEERTAATSALNDADREEVRTLEAFRVVAEANARDSNDQARIDNYWRSVRHARFALDEFDEHEQIPSETRQTLLDMPEQSTIEFIAWVRDQ